MTNDPEFIKDFLIESHENLDKVDTHLLALEKNPSSQADLAEIFRAFHTIKGTSRMFEFGHIESVTHAGEDLLGRLRDGRLAFRPEIADALLAVVDAVRRLLARVETQGSDEGEGPETVLSALSRMTAAPALADAPPAAAPPPEKTEPPEPATAGLTETTLRVDVAVLDRLMADIGELVLTRNQIVQRAMLGRDPVGQAAAQRLNHLTSELQVQVMKLRLQPIGSVWNKIPRMVRDLCSRLGKRARLITDGAETELDKSVLEAIKDPLTHLVRNAVDHGIEPPAQRRAHGKDPEGLISLRAQHEGGVVVVETADDGNGVDIAAIRRKAVEKGWLTAAAGDAAEERDLVNFLFQPGFSTASAVTEVSGRGVGLDVVKANIERIGGSIEIRSRPGMGTAFRLKIPLTLAIVPALIVWLDDRRYAIPQASLLEMIRLQGRAGGRRIEWIDGTPVFRLRGRLLPVVFLRHALGGAAPSREEEGVSLVVLQSGDRPFGLVVDRVADTEEVVVKPLGRHLKTLPLYEGATIMGDGRVALILDIAGLAEATHVVARGEPEPVARGARSSAAESEPVETLLLLRSRDDGRIALPLTSVMRLEKFNAARLERAGGEEVVQYRGGLLRLVRLGALLKERRQAPRRPSLSSPPDAMVPVVVCQRQGRLIGLVVEDILDIVHDRVGARRPGTREGIASTAVVRGRVAEILDPERILDMADRDLSPGPKP